MSRIILYSLLLFFLFDVTACKYPEGPNFTLKTKKSRLKGTWEVRSIDGIEAEDGVYTYTFEGDGSGEVQAFGNKNDLTWLWEDNKASLSVIIKDDIFDYSIQRLTNENMDWLDESGVEWKLEKQ